MMSQTFHWKRFFILLTSNPTESAWINRGFRWSPSAWKVEWRKIYIHLCWYDQRVKIICSKLTCEIVFITDDRFEPESNLKKTKIDQSVQWNIFRFSKLLILSHVTFLCLSTINYWLYENIALIFIEET